MAKINELDKDLDAQAIHVSGSSGIEVSSQQPHDDDLSSEATYVSGGSGTVAMAKHEHDDDLSSESNYVSGSSGSLEMASHEQDDMFGSETTYVSNEVASTEPSYVTGAQGTSILPAANAAVISTAEDVDVFDLDAIAEEQTEINVAKANIMQIDINLKANHDPGSIQLDGVLAENQQPAAIHLQFHQDGDSDAVQTLNDVSYNDSSYAAAEDLSGDINPWDFT